MHHQLSHTLLPPHPLPHFGQMVGVFNDEEIDRIRFFKKILDFTPAKIEGEGEATDAHQDYRVCDNAMMTVDENTQWLWNKVGDLTASANYDLFLYDISYIESISYLVYEGNGESRYEWHTDINLMGYRKYDRKISGIIMLSNPEDYEGGELLVDITGTGNDDSITDVKLAKGDVLFFDSNFRHCVKPVTKGTREVLVFWVHGRNKL